MRSIDDTLIIIREIADALPVKVDIVLVGGVAAVLHGVERTTVDVDFCVYSDFISRTGTRAFFEVLTRALPQRFTARLIEASKIPDDPLKHDIIFIDDNKGEYERVDLLIARYKWELEGISQAASIREVPFPVLDKSYLAAMKLFATGHKDAHDIVTLFSLMNEEEKAKTRELAKRIGRDKKLERILSPADDEVREMPGEYL